MTLRISALLLVALALLPTLTRADPRAITVHVADHPDGPPIPADFTGLSFEISNVSPDKTGRYIFSGDDKELINLFRTIGIKNLRVGGGTADLPEYKIPQPPDIDQLFAFAKAADVRIIYTFRLLNGDAKSNAQLAKYIHDHYASQLVCYQIGNEPDWHSFHTAPNHPRDPRIVEATLNNTGSAYPSFLKTWREFASEINALVPDAKYTGPDTGSNYPVPGTKDTDFNGEPWTVHFTRDEKPTGRLVFVTHHDYPGQSATGVSVPDGVDRMLSREWPEKRYTALFDHALAPVQKLGLTYRMTEANDHTGGVNGASNAYVSALWVLDYLHWHAARHAAGVNFHNKAWIFTDTVYESPDGHFHFNPKAYGIRAFYEGSHGSPTPVTIDNGGAVNLTAYAVRGADHDLYVTLINKEHGPAAPDATVTLAAPGISGRATGLLLTSPDHNPIAKTGITLGGAPITNDAWNGHWSDLNECKDNQVTVTVPPTSALVVKLDLK
jgi:hypothetical protein